jgi:CRP-like cAMP-binding protein
METLEDLLQLDPNSTGKQYQKGEILQRKGDQNPKTYFIKQGLLRSYIIDSKGKEHIFQFAPEDWIIADVESMEYDHPAELYIDCIEDTEVVAFDRYLLSKHISDVGLQKRFMRLHYRRMGALQRRVIMQMSAPAIDRYAYFLETYPQLPNRVPQHMIASFLGIAPQTLSTLRGKIARTP